MTAFPLPIMYTAWGTSPTYEWDDWKIARLARLAKDSGFKTVAPQLGYVTATQIRELKKAGLTVPVWNVVGPSSSKALYDPLGADGLIVQVEGQYQLEGALAALDEGIAAGQPRACITTYAGLEDGQWSKLAGRGVTDCHVECYRSDSIGHADLDRMLNQGVVYGIPQSRLYAVCGTFNGETPAMYLGLDKLGRSYGCYLGEPMTGTEWAAWGGVNVGPIPQPYYWVLSAGTSVLHEERAITYAPGDDGLGRMLKWMATNKAVVRVAANVKLAHQLR